MATAALHAAIQAGSLGLGLSATGFLLLAYIGSVLQARPDTRPRGPPRFAPPVGGIQSARTPLAARSHRVPQVLIAQGTPLAARSHRVPQVLIAQGIIRPATVRVAGASGGAIAAAALCSGVPPEFLISTSMALAAACSNSSNSSALFQCAYSTWSVGAFLRRALEPPVGLPADAAERCSGRAFLTLTRAGGGGAALLEEPQPKVRGRLLISAAFAPTRTWPSKSALFGGWACLVDGAAALRVHVPGTRALVAGQPGTLACPLTSPPRHACMAHHNTVTRWSPASTAPRT